MTLFEPGPVKVMSVTSSEPRDAELVGYVRSEADFLAVVRVPGELLLLEVHPSRVVPR
jgi:hypothetical protein